MQVEGVERIPLDSLRCAVMSSVNRWTFPLMWESFVPEFCDPIHAVSGCLWSPVRMFRQQKQAAVLDIIGDGAEADPQLNPGLL